MTCRFTISMAKVPVNGIRFHLEIGKSGSKWHGRGPHSRTKRGDEPLHLCGGDASAVPSERRVQFGGEYCGVRPRLPTFVAWRVIAARLAAAGNRLAARRTLILRNWRPFVKQGEPPNTPLKIRWMVASDWSPDNNTRQYQLHRHSPYHISK